MTPKTISVIIEGRDTEEKATLVQYSQEYRSGEYETDDGARFYVAGDYILERNGKPCKIPGEVIRQLSTMRQRLAEEQEKLNRQAKKSESNLILPPGY